MANKERKRLSSAREVEIRKIVESYRVASDCMHGCLCFICAVEQLLTEIDDLRTMYEGLQIQIAKANEIRAKATFENLEKE